MSDQLRSELLSSSCPVAISLRPTAFAAPSFSNLRHPQFTASHEPISSSDSTHLSAESALQRCAGKLRIALWLENNGHFCIFGENVLRLTTKRIQLESLIYRGA